jgi:hypothetical protein
MNTRILLQDSAERIFADHVDKPLLDTAELGEYPQALDEVIAENGFFEIAMEESGVTLSEALSVLRVAGRHALPLPLAENILANRWIGSSGERSSIGVGDGSGVLDVAWGRNAQAVIGVSLSGDVMLTRDFDVVEGCNLAGEPRDRIMPRDWEPLEPREDVFRLLALTRSVMMAGALEKALSLSLDYVGEREQFGRPISKFQAIQHHMAVMAAEVAAATRSADAALDCLGSAREEEEVAQAKARVGESVALVAELAQQVHGAMGYTHEHQLHHFTRRLWAWRDEYGGEPYWQRRLGERVAGLAAADGIDAVWNFIATRG